MQGTNRFRLVVRRGPQPNQTYELTKDIITIGRDITNDIVINDPESSRHHMRLTRGAGGYTLEDLGSTNGTFINGQRLTGAKPLNPGDMIGLGETVTLGYEVVPESGQDAGQASPYAPQHPAPVPAVESQAPDAPYVQDAAQQRPPAPADAPGYAYGSGYSEPSYQPGYSGEYDPYAAREEGSRNTMRWVAIGCVGLLLFCCCISVAGVYLIDQACAWDNIPVVSSLLNTLGIYSTC
jgi:predicted component of type VI protein secretion system